MDLLSTAQCDNIVSGLSPLFSSGFFAPSKRMPMYFICNVPVYGRSIDTLSVHHILAISAGQYQGDELLL